MTAQPTKENDWLLSLQGLGQITSEIELAGNAVIKPSGRKASIDDLKYLNVYRRAFLSDHLNPILG